MSRPEGVLGVDPGTDASGWALLIDGTVYDSGVATNSEILGLLQWHKEYPVAIEMIASYGMPVGREVFETCVWIGRFVQFVHPKPAGLIYRKDVKMHLCGTPKAKDGNIRQALLDKLGPQGTKKAPGPTYGVKSHAWAALAVAVTFLETKY